mgnify:FL=1
MITEMFGHGYDPERIYRHLSNFFSEDVKGCGLTLKGVEDIITEAFCKGIPDADWHTARIRLCSATYDSDEALGIIAEKLEMDVYEEDGKHYMTYIAIPRRGGYAEPVYATQEITESEYETLNRRL